MNHLDIDIGPFPDYDECHNLPYSFWDETSSINTNGECILLYKHLYCDGEFRIFNADSPHHNNFVYVRFNDEARSIEYF